MLSVGIVLGLVAIGLAWGFEKLFSTFVPESSNPNITDALTKLSNLFNDAYRDNIVHLSAYLAVIGLVLFILGWILVKLHRHAPATSPVTSSRPAASLSQPESLTASSTVASFIPKGPPKLPSAAKKATAKPKAKTATKKKTTATHKRKKK
jgi:hypothetical protein